jgi:hypothetical protein
VNHYNYFFGGNTVIDADNINASLDLAIARESINLTTPSSSQVLPE